MGRDLNLDGTETSILKAIGIGGGEVPGDTLADRTSGLEEAEFLDSLRGLVTQGFVECDRGSLQSMDDVKASRFHVNSGYSKDIRNALGGKTQEKPKSKRVRRE